MLTKRKQQAIKTREKISGAALELLKVHTIEEIGVSDICRLAGVSVGAFYHYFENKDDIVLEVYRDLDVRFEELAKSPRARRLPVFDFILAYSKCYSDFQMEVGAAFARKVYGLQSKVFLDVKRPIHVRLREYLLRKQRAGKIDAALDVGEFCDYLIVLLRGSAYDWCLHEGAYNLTEKLFTFLDKALAKYRPLLGD
ncbi:MAG: TetR/AcrR family transcriptional regulator [Treponema sp.]|jgi:AcrR family transcriptional regulator|nr:TetR/AcrR family transcriptional regulator [Treponema sp.]